MTRDPEQSVSYILEERGHFWWNDVALEENCILPDGAIPGVLRIDKQGRSRLDLDGVLTQGGHPFATLMSEINDLQRNRTRTIQGRLIHSNKCVLLMDLFGGKSSAKTAGISHSGFTATYCLVSEKHFSEKAEEMTFKALRIPLVGYEEWLWLGSISGEETDTTFSASYKKPDDLSYEVPGGNITIDYDVYRPRYFFKFMYKIEMREEAQITFTSNVPAPLLQMQHEYGLIEDLFVILTGSEYFYERPSVQAENESWCDFYFLKHKRTAEPPEKHECVLQFPKIKESFGRIFEAWKLKRQEYGPGYYLYLGTRRGMSLFVEHRFVNLVWGIESFHRTKYGERDVDSALSRKIERILSAVQGAADKKWLANRLRHAGEPSLEDRLFEVLSDLSLGFADEEVRRFAKNCADLRNKISHFGGVSDKSGYSDFIATLDKYSDAISYLYHALLLQEIGVERALSEAWLFDSFTSPRIKLAFADAGLRRLHPKSSPDEDFSDAS